MRCYIFINTQQYIYLKAHNSLCQHTIINVPSNHLSTIHSSIESNQYLSLINFILKSLTLVLFYLLICISFLRPKSLFFTTSRHSRINLGSREQFSTETKSSGRSTSLGTSFQRIILSVASSLVSTFTRMQEETRWNADCTSSKQVHNGDSHCLTLNRKSFSRLFL